MAEYKLSYTAEEINEKLGKIDTIQEQVNNLSDGNVDLDDTLTQSGKAADAKAVGDKFAEIEPRMVELVAESVNLLDMNTMWTYGHWIYFTGTVGAGNEIGVLSNQYTTSYAAVKIPVYGIKSVTFSTNSININGTNTRNVCVLGWYMADESMKCLDYRYNISAHELDIAEGLTFNIPYGTSWLCLTLGSCLGIMYDGCWIMANEGETALPYEPYDGTANAKLKVYGRTLLTDDTVVKSNIALELPPKYALVVGDTFEMFYKGIVNAVNPDVYYVEVQCGIGAAYAKRFICTPTLQNIGNHTMTVKLYDQEHNLLDEKTVTLSVKAKMSESPASETVVLYVGDSLAVGGGVPGEFKRRLTATDGTPVGDGLSNISFIGTCNGNGADYEGWGGYSLNTYTTEGKGNTFMWITATHDKTDDDQHSIYKDVNNGQWKLETIEEGRIKLIRTSGLVLPSTGTLTWVSGGVNHSDIIYTASEQASGNPFWNATTGANDFAAYAQRLGKSKIDYVYVMLGWNSASTSKDDYVALAKKFVDDVLASFPNCKIVYLGLQIPSRDGLGANYGASGIYSRYYDLMQHVFNLNDWYAEVAKAYPNNVSFVNIAGQFDTEHNMITAERTANVRNTKVEVYQSNGVHPAHTGQMQIADACYRDFVHKLQS